MQIINANLTEKIFVWTPPKTGSMRSVTILSNLGFKSYKLEDNYLKPNSVFFHNHEYPIINNYKLLITLRNPYEQMVSYFKMSKSKERGDIGKLVVGPEINSNDFENFTLSLIYGNSTFTNYLSFDDVYPDYIIRTENMFEDYLKIPFINRTEYYKSGKLHHVCSTKVNQSRYEQFDYRVLYNQRIADLIYYSFINIFELGGYDRNSWRI